MTGRLLSWYGDDFTGSAAVMEVLAFAGLPAVLFLDCPTAADLAAFPKARAIGIAGSARARGPDWMRAELPAVFASLKAIGADLVLYKICSTLDSAPETGSIGCAIEIGLQTFPNTWVPVLVAAPPIGRWQAFGNLFAQGGDDIHRLDRHPVMSRHPVTPMNEADVARHLQRQTDLPVACLSLPDIGAADFGAAAVARHVAAGARIVTVDCTNGHDLARIGALLGKMRGRNPFIVGSQGVAYALVGHMRATGALPAEGQPVRTGPADRIAVVSGSVSAVTAAQIGWAEAQGFGLVALDPSCVTDPARMAAETGRAIAAAVRMAQAGRSVLVHSARGPNDPRVAAYRAALDGAGLDSGEGNRMIGEVLGHVLAEILRETGLRRAVIAGGDTASHAARRLGLQALTALAETVPGAALCEGHLQSGGRIEIALKGGQMGTTDYFGRIRNGGGPVERRG